MPTHFDAVVIGSGPSGTVAALELLDAGWKVALIEKETLPRYKTCGGGLVYRGRRRLPFDVSEIVDRTFYQIEVHLGRSIPPLTAKRNQPIISMVMRDTFDYFLVQKALDKGLTLYQGEALELLQMGETAQLKTSKNTLYSRFVIAADGALSPTAKMAGWAESRMMCPALEYEIQVPQTDFERLSKSVRFDIDVVPFGYGWCFPKKNHLSVGVGNFMKANKKAGNLKDYYQKYLKILQIHEVTEAQSHGFIIPISQRKDGFVKQNVFLTGDAAGFADPVTAEGISNAILSGQLVAKALTTSSQSLTDAAANYTRLLNEQLLPELKTGEKLAQIFYKNKTLRNLGLKKFGQQAAEAMTDVFMGDRSYPKDYKASIRRRLGKALLSGLKV